MSKAGVIIQKGVVIEALPNTLFKVVLENDIELLCHLSGKMRMNNIKVLTDDKVEVEISPYDLTKGRIFRRNK